MTDSKRERERERERFAARQLLLVLMLFEEVRFKASFKDRKRTGVTEKKRKRTSDLYSNEAKLTITMLLPFVVGKCKRFCHP